MQVHSYINPNLPVKYIVKLNAKTLHSWYPKVKSTAVQKYNVSSFYIFDLFGNFIHTFVNLNMFYMN